MIPPVDHSGIATTPGVDVRFLHQVGALHVCTPANLTSSRLLTSGTAIGAQGQRLLADTVHVQRPRVEAHPDRRRRAHPVSPAPPKTSRSRLLTPCTLHPTPYTLHPTLHATPYTLRPTPCVGIGVLRWTCGWRVDPREWWYTIFGFSTVSGATSDLFFAWLHFQTPVHFFMRGYSSWTCMPCGGSREGGISL